MKFLKKADLFEVVPPLSNILHNRLRVDDPPRSFKNMHASEFTREDPELCPRQLALMTKTLKKSGPKTLSTSESVTFDIGRKLQDSVAHWFADMNATWGDWRCLGCNYMHEFTMRPKNCHECGAANFKPEEMRFKSKTAGLSCGLDLAVKLPGSSKLCPVEIKTIDKDQFKKLEMPLAEHRVRTTLYLRVIADDPSHPAAEMIDTTAARILYVSKGGYGCSQDWLKKSLLHDSFSPFKEYMVPRNDDMVEPYWAKGRQFYDYLTNGCMPSGVCPSSMSKRATKCVVRKDCWGGKYPPGEKT